MKQKSVKDYVIIDWTQLIDDIANELDSDIDVEFDIDNEGIIIDVSGLEIENNQYTVRYIDNQFLMEDKYGEEYICDFLFEIIEVLEGIA